MENIDLGYISYLPFEMRTPDRQYQDMLKRIRTKGRIAKPIQGGEVRMVVGHQMTFPAENGFTIQTLRDLSGNMMKGALAEHIGFLNGATTLDELKSFGMPEVFWKRWVTEEKCADFGLPPGNLGPASYGGTWSAIPDRNGKPFNQIDALVEGIKERPFLRTWRISPWYPPDIIGPRGTRKVVVAPCHGEIHAFAFPESKELVIHHTQRSGDIPVGVMLNTMQYFAFGMMLAKIMGYRFVELVYNIVDAHIYECQYPFVDELLQREVFPFPTVSLEADHARIQDFRATDFKLWDDYHPNPKMTIPTPV